MSDDQLIHSDGSSIASLGGKGSVTESITVDFSADISRSRHAKILRQVSNILHALLANSMRYAAIGEGANAGASFPIHQQTYSAAANIDAAAKMLEDGMRAVIDPSRLPPPPGGGVMGRA
jgi:hypothetical protein